MVTKFTLQSSAAAAKLAVAALCCAGLQVAAQTPALPAPDTVALDKLGYMSTFPPHASTAG